MSQPLGERIMAIVTDKNDQETFVQKEGTTFKVIDEDSSRLELGQTVEGFAFTDKNHHLVFTTHLPDVRIGRYGWGEVVKVKRDLGVFVDVGWPNKDLVVSRDDLSELSHLWPKEKDQLYLTVDVDKNSQIWGKLAPEDEFNKQAKTGTKDMHNNDSVGTVFLLRKSGTYVFTEEHYIGFVHPSEREREPRLGETVSARVIGLREDGVLYMSLLPRAHEVIDDDAAMLVELLKREENHELPFNTKSDPQLIRNKFGISKGQFKRALGRLLKKNLIEQDNSGIKLLDSGKEMDK